MRLRTIIATTVVTLGLSGLTQNAVADTIDYVTASNGQFGTVDVNTGAFQASRWAPHFGGLPNFTGPSTG